MPLRQLSSPSVMDSLALAFNVPLRASLAQPLWRPLPQILPPIRIPLALAGISSISSVLEGIWETILRAVPKKKTSYSKKRSRQLAGKALKDVTELNRCSACGRMKRAHVLCTYCVRAIMESRAKDLIEPIWKLRPLSKKHVYSTGPLMYTKEQLKKGAKYSEEQQQAFAKLEEEKAAAKAGKGAEAK